MEKELIILLENEREKMYIDLNVHAHIAVVADLGCGKTTFLANITKQVLESDEEVEIYILRTFKEEPAFVFNDKYRNKNIKYILADELESILNELMKRDCLSRNDNRVLLVIDSLLEKESVFMTESVKEKIDYILRLGRGLNVNLFIGVTDETIIKSVNVPVMVYGRNINKNRELQIGEFLIDLKMLHRCIIKEKIYLNELKTNALVDEIQKRKEENIKKINKSIEELEMLGFVIKDEDGYILKNIYSRDNSVFCEMEEGE